MKTYNTTIRVRYSEIDKMNVAHNASYLHWFEIGRTELLRQVGITYRELEEEGFMLPVAESVCRYMAPARYDDELEIRTTLLEMKKRTVKLGVEIFHKQEDKILAKGYTQHICVEIKSNKITSLPEFFSSKIKKAAEVRQETEE